MALIPIEIESVDAFIDTKTGIQHFAITVNGKVYDFASWEEHDKNDSDGQWDRLWDALKQLNERIDKLENQK